MGGGAGGQTSKPTDSHQRLTPPGSMATRSARVGQPPPTRPTKRAPKGQNKKRHTEMAREPRRRQRRSSQRGPRARARPRVGCTRREPRRAPCAPPRPSRDQQRAAVAVGSTRATGPTARRPPHSVRVPVAPLRPHVPPGAASSGSHRVLLLPPAPPPLSRPRHLASRVVPSAPPRRHHPSGVPIWGGINWGASPGSVALAWRFSKAHPIGLQSQCAPVHGANPPQTPYLGGGATAASAHADTCGVLARPASSARAPATAVPDSSWVVRITPRAPIGGRGGHAVTHQSRGGR